MAMTESRAAGGPRWLSYRPMRLDGMPTSTIFVGSGFGNFGGTWPQLMQ